jgi:hypothetical protein
LREERLKIDNHPAVVCQEEERLKSDHHPHHQNAPAVLPNAPLTHVEQYSAQGVRSENWWTKQEIEIDDNRSEILQ